MRLSSQIFKLALAIFVSAFFSPSFAQTPAKAPIFDDVQTDYYRRMLARGNSPEAAAAWVLSADGKNHVGAKKYADAYVACHGRTFLPNAAQQAAFSKTSAMEKGLIKVETYKCNK